MNHLTPEVRVNKNGVPVVKHVLPPKMPKVIDLPQMPAMRSMMAKMAHSSKSQQQTISAQLIDIENDNFDVDDLANINKLPPEVKTHVEEVLANGDDYAKFITLGAVRECRTNQVPYVMGTMEFHRKFNEESFLNESDDRFAEAIRNGMVSALKNRFSFEFFGNPEGEATQERIDYFKADILSNHLDFRHVYSLAHERHVALSKIVDNIDLVEDGVPAIMKVKKGMRQWRSENKQSTDAPYLRVPDVLEISSVSREFPDMEEAFYRYARMHGEFNIEGFRTMMETKSPALFEGAL